MRKSLIIVGSIAIAIALVAWLAIPRITNDTVGGPEDGVFAWTANCRHLHLAISQFQIDQRASGKPNPEKPSIYALLRDNYIDQKFFDRLQTGGGTYVISFSDRAAPSDPSVQYFCKKGIVEITSNGDGGVYTWKKWWARQAAKPKAE
jgi:hypothetical protein